MRYECRNCGGSIPREVGRVAGDNDHCVAVCPNCVDSDQSGARGGTTWTHALRVRSETRTTGARGRHR